VFTKNNKTYRVIFTKSRTFAKKINKLIMISIQSVSKQFANHLALDNVSFEIPKGKIFGLLGPNGAGKTTLIRIINRILYPDKGEILFNGEKIDPTFVNRIGYLPEERGLYKKMKVEEQITYLGQLRGLSLKDCKKRTEFWLGKLDMLSWKNKKVEDLSKGMQQKVQFVTTVLHEPELLIFDEPFSGFDPLNALALKNEILELKQRGATIIFSSHSMASVEELCDHIALINKAKLILYGDIQEIKKSYQTNSFVIEFEKSFEIEPLKKVYENLSILENIGTNFAIQIEVKNQISNNELLEKIIPFGEIVSFKRKIPALNDIFIEIVRKAENKQSLQALSGYTE